MHKGYIRDSKPYPAAKQAMVLHKSGLGARQIYTDDDLDVCIKSLRKGDVLEVAGLRALGPNRKVIANVVEQVHERGAAVMDSATRRRTDNGSGVRLMEEATGALANEARGMNGSDAARHGRAGALASAKSRAQGRMPMRMVETYWFDKTLQNNEAMARINGDPNYPKPYSLGTVYRHLGPREVPAGRRTSAKTYKIAVKRQAVRLAAGAVYFIRAVNGKGPVKIGFSTNAKGRLKTLQTSNHGELEIIAAIEGTHEDEHSLHAEFNALRLKGEWFKFEGKLKAYVESLPRYLKEK